MAKSTTKAVTNKKTPVSSARCTQSQLAKKKAKIGTASSSSSVRKPTVRAPATTTAHRPRPRGSAATSVASSAAAVAKTPSCSASTPTQPPSTKPTRTVASQRRNLREPASQLSADQAHARRQFELQRAFFHLARAEATRALRALDTDTTAIATAMPFSADALADTRALNVSLPHPSQKTLAELFTAESPTGTLASPASAPENARGVFAKLWNLEMAPMMASTQAPAGAVGNASPAPPHTPTWRAAALAQRVETCVRSHIRYPWPYNVELSDAEDEEQTLPPPPVAMVPCLWHPRSPTTARAYQLLHMSASGMTTVRGVETELDEDPVWGTISRGRSNFFDLCGFTSHEYTT